MRFDIEIDDRQAARALAELRRRGESMEPAGSPAHAGIDPRCATSAAGCAWFPRTRGDRPGTARWNASTARVPPHTRG